MLDKEIKLIISDFDNTLYDWFAMWRHSFIAIYQGINVNVLGRKYDDESILSDIRKVHQRYGTSEYVKLLDELPEIWEKHSAREKKKLYANILSNYFAVKRDHTLLYDGVLNFIENIKNKGVNFAVYTESQPIYSEDRLVSLGLDGLVDALYAPETQGVFSDAEYNKIPFSKKEKCVTTKVKILPKHDKKPNPSVLNDIIKDFGVNKNQVIYIGDSMMKDICMANSANVTSVFAKYGIVNHLPEYQLLKKVSHWPDVDVVREVSISKDECAPDFVINSFGEIGNLFKF